MTSGLTADRQPNFSSPSRTRRCLDAILFGFKPCSVVDAHHFLTLTSNSRLLRGCRHRPLLGEPRFPQRARSFSLTGSYLLANLLIDFPGHSNQLSADLGQLFRVPGPP